MSNFENIKYIIFISVLGIEPTFGLVCANALLLSYMIGPGKLFLKYDWITLLPLLPSCLFFFFPDKISLYSPGWSGSCCVISLALNSQMSAS